VPKITYGGPTSRDDISTEFIVREPAADGKKGKPVRFRKAVPLEVSDELAALLTGDDAPKGHKFEAADVSESTDTAGAGEGDSASEDTPDANTTTEATGRAGARRGASR
jgi:hypothetical protein